jgi:glucan phosphoethanolaminetransferase (alkaline phosphatase superfamily)
MISLNSFDLIDFLYRAYTIILTYISNFLQSLGLNDHKAIELSPIVLLFLAILTTYLSSHMFTAFKKYVLGFIILFAIIILASVIVK